MQTHLKASAILILGILFGCAMNTDPSTASSEMTEQRVTTVTASQAVDLIASNRDVVILDIRTPAEFARGHVAGAININYSADDRDKQLAALDKGKTYVMH